MSGLPTFIVGYSDPIELQREVTRSWLASGLIALLAAVCLMIVIFAFNSGSKEITDQIMNGILSPLVAIVGSVVGFYFGARSKD